MLDRTEYFMRQKLGCRKSMCHIIGIMDVIKEEPRPPKYSHPCCYIGYSVGNYCSTIKASNGHTNGQLTSNQRYAIWFGRFMHTYYLRIAP